MVDSRRRHGRGGPSARDGGIAATFVVFAGLLLTAAPVRAAPAAEASREVAREHYDRGVELAKRGEFREASDEFRAAYEASPHYATLYNYAQAELALGRVPEAIDAFKRYLRDGGAQIPADRRDQVARHVALIEGRFASLTVDTDPPGAAVQVDGADVGTTPFAAPARLTPGTHVVSASRAGYQAAMRTVKVGEGEGQKVTLSLTKVVVPIVPPQQTAPVVATAVEVHASSTPAASWRAGPGVWLVGAGVLAGGAAGVLYAWNRGRYGQYQEEAAQLQTDTSAGRRGRVMAYDALGDSIHRASVATVSVAVAAGALVAAGAGWLVVESRRANDSPRGGSAHAFAFDLAPERAALLWSATW